MTTGINTQSEIVSTLTMLGNHACGNHTYTAMLTNAINATGKELIDLSVGELMDICLQCSDTHNKQFAGV